MTIDKFLVDAIQQLKAAGIMTARLDCLVLLEDELHTPRAGLLAHTEREISRSHLLNLNKKITQRAAHTPLSYLRGKAEFYGREFIIDEAVLVPRPESEKVIDLLKNISFAISPALVPLRIADVGCGSGCLGITAALEFPGSYLDLYDIDEGALTIAARNARRYILPHIAYYLNDLFSAEQPRPFINDPASRRYDVILANLPYVPTNYEINEAAQHEPQIALFGGMDGMDVYRKFWKQLGRRQDDVPPKPRYVITESFPFQHEQNAALAKAAGYLLQATDDFAQSFARNV